MPRILGAGATDGKTQVARAPLKSAVPATPSHDPCLTHQAPAQGTITMSQELSGNDNDKKNNNKKTVIILINSKPLTPEAQEIALQQAYYSNGNLGDRKNVTAGQQKTLVNTNATPTIEQHTQISLFNLILTGIINTIILNMCFLTVDPQMECDKSLLLLLNNKNIASIIQRRFCLLVRRKCF